MANNSLDNGKRMAQFYAAQLRFFRQLCTAAKVGGCWKGGVLLWRVCGCGCVEAQAPGYILRTCSPRCQCVAALHWSVQAGRDMEQPEHMCTPLYGPDVCCCWRVVPCCVCVQVDTVVELCLQALADGMCPVIGLQSTGEARTAAFVKATQASKGAWHKGWGLGLAWVTHRWRQRLGCQLQRLPGAVWSCGVALSSC
jgi:hypothetical protein